jgi:hypothetical protein
MIGLVFERGQFWVLGSSLVALQAVVVCCTAIAWRISVQARTARMRYEEQMLLTHHDEQHERLLSDANNPAHPTS